MKTTFVQEHTKFVFPGLNQKTSASMGPGSELCSQRCCPGAPHGLLLGGTSGTLSCSSLWESLLVFGALFPCPNRAYKHLFARHVEPLCCWGWQKERVHCLVQAQAQFTFIVNFFFATLLSGLGGLQMIVRVTWYHFHLSNWQHVLWGAGQGVLLPSLVVGDAPHASFSLHKSLPIAEEGAVVFGCGLLAVIPGRFIGWAVHDKL